MGVTFENDNNTNMFLTIPEDLILGIFSILPDRELMQIIPLICKKCLELSNSTKLEGGWKRRIIQLLEVKDLNLSCLKVTSWKMTYLDFKKSPCAYAKVLHDLGNFRKAEIEYEKGLRLEPENVAALQGYAKILAGRTKFADAQSLLAKAVQIDPKNTSILKQYGTLLYILGRETEAKSQHAKALRIERM